MEYPKNAPVSKNVRVQPEAKTIGDLEAIYAQPEGHFYYPQPQGIGGIAGAPLGPQQVEAWAQRQPEYQKQLEDERFRVLLEVLRDQQFPIK